ncbi:hypothetical protein [Tardiphaga sp.]|jgi:hypothetical protein|uniref:hypothetical protein n=1 Tax=Tardiphaga sp. TaxID=1926292 RepID=UPI0037DA5A9E
MAKTAKLKATPIEATGWVLICKDEASPDWHIAWMDVFSRKKTAIAFAKDNRWSQPYRAVRGRLAVDLQ